MHRKETALKRRLITDECCVINHSKTVDIETSVAGGHRCHFLRINNYSLETVRNFACRLVAIKQLILRRQVLVNLSQARCESLWRNLLRL